MLVEITCTSKNPALFPATDLGYVLFKNPARTQSFDLSVGEAWVCYPRADDKVATCAFILDIDPVKLSKAEAGRHPASLEPYVNDRPYTANSMVASALANVFSTAMTGRCDDRPHAAANPMSLTIHIPVIAGNPRIAKVLFEPLGWKVTAFPHELTTPGDTTKARHMDLVLTGEIRVADALSQLYILIPVLDGGRKHYFQSDDEADKLLKRAGWLARHPDADRIVDKYLNRQRTLATDVKAALAGAKDSAATATTTPSTAEVAPDTTGPAAASQRLTQGAHDAPTVLAGLDADTAVSVTDTNEAVLENRSLAGGVDADGQPRRLNDARLDAARDALVDNQVTSVADVGCGEGQLVERLLATDVERIIALDASPVALDRCKRKLLNNPAAGRVEYLASAGFGVDRRLAGIDAVAAVEVIEHVDPWRLDTFTASLFSPASRIVVVSTPNSEYNVRWPQMTSPLRHRDHRFEWDRNQFAVWCAATGAKFGYTWEISPVGLADVDVGPPTQMVVFVRIR